METEMLIFKRLHTSAKRCLRLNERLRMARRFRNGFIRFYERKGNESMNILQVTTITLEDAEIAALQTLKDAYIQCASVDCFSCVDCPLNYDDDGCIGQYAEKVLNSQKARDKK